MHFNGIGAAADGKEDARALAVDERRDPRWGDELDGMPREQELRGEQGAVRGAQDQD
jgi:hypothetical protein